jgi:hypothetical protein
MDLDGDVLGALVGGGRGKRKRGIPPEPTLVLGAHVAQMSGGWTRLVNVDRRHTFTMYCMKIGVFFS